MGWTAGGPQSVGIQPVGDAEFSVVKCQASPEALYKGKWTKRWQNSFRKDKFKMMSIGKNSLGITCKMLSSDLAITTQKQDLEVITERSLKALAVCPVAVRKSKKTLAIITKGTEQWDTWLYSSCCYPKPWHSHILSTIGCSDLCNLIRW